MNVGMTYGDPLLSILCKLSFSSCRVTIQGGHLQVSQTGIQD